MELLASPCFLFFIYTLTLKVKTILVDKSPRCLSISLSCFSKVLVIHIIFLVLLRKDNGCGRKGPTLKVYVREEGTQQQQQTFFPLCPQHVSHASMLKLGNLPVSVCDCTDAHICIKKQLHPFYLSLDFHNYM